MNRKILAIVGSVVGVAALGASGWFGWTWWQARQMGIERVLPEAPLVMVMQDPAKRWEALKGTNLWKELEPWTTPLFAPASARAGITITPDLIASGLGRQVAILVEPAAPAGAVAPNPARPDYLIAVQLNLKGQLAAALKSAAGNPDLSLDAYKGVTVDALGEQTIYGISRDLVLVTSRYDWLKKVVDLQEAKGGIGSLAEKPLFKAARARVSGKAILYVWADPGRMPAPATRPGAQAAGGPAKPGGSLGGVAALPSAPGIVEMAWADGPAARHGEPAAGGLKYRVFSAPGAPMSESWKQAAAAKPGTIDALPPLPASAVIAQVNLAPDLQSTLKGALGPFAQMVGPQLAMFGPDWGWAVLESSSGRGLGLGVALFARTKDGKKTQGMLSMLAAGAGQSRGLFQPSAGARVVGGVPVTAVTFPVPVLGPVEASAAVVKDLVVIGAGDAVADGFVQASSSKGAGLVGSTGYAAVSKGLPKTFHGWVYADPSRLGRALAGLAGRLAAAQASSQAVAGGAGPPAGAGAAAGMPANWNPLGWSKGMVGTTVFGKDGMTGEGMILVSDLPRSEWKAIFDGARMMAARLDALRPKPYPEQAVAAEAAEVNRILGSEIAHPDWVVRQRAVYTLAQLATRSEAARSQVEGAIVVNLGSDPEWKVRQAIAATLGRVGDSAAVPALQKAAKDKNSHVAHEARAALRAIQARASGAQPATAHGKKGRPAAAKPYAPKHAPKPAPIAPAGLPL